MNFKKIALVKTWQNNGAVKEIEPNCTVDLNKVTAYYSQPGVGVTVYFGSVRLVLDITYEKFDKIMRPDYPSDYI